MGRARERATREVARERATAELRREHAITGRGKSEFHNVECKDQMNHGLNRDQQLGRQGRSEANGAAGDAAAVCLAQYAGERPL